MFLPKTQWLKQGIFTNVRSIGSTSVNERISGPSYPVFRNILTEVFGLANAFGSRRGENLHSQNAARMNPDLLMERVFWPSKQKHLSQKTKQGFMRFRSGKKRTSNISWKEVHRLWNIREIGDEVENFFVRPIVNEQNQKKDIMVAVDQL